MEKNGGPEATLFVDETGFEDFARRYGRSPSNYPLPSFASFDKTSVIGVVGFLGLVQTIRFDANAYIVLPVLRHNLSGSNSSSKSITLVKLPPYSYDLNPIEMVVGLAKAYSSLRFKELSMIFQPWQSKTSTAALGGYSVR